MTEEESSEKSISIGIDNEDLKVAQEFAIEAGAELQLDTKLQFGDPVSIVLIAGGIMAVTKVTFDLIDKYRGGMIVDLRPSAEQLVRRDKSVTAGVALVITDDRKVRIEVKDAPKDALERWVSEIIRGVLKTAKDVTDSASKEFGEEKVKHPLDS
jgi:hypothetical protein